MQKEISERQHGFLNCGSVHVPDQRKAQFLARKGTLASPGRQKAG